MDSDLREMVQKWLSEEGIFAKLVADDQANFHFVIKFPDEHHSMDILQPKGKEDAIIIGCATTVSPSHLSKMRELTGKKRESFLMDFRMMLNMMPVDFQLNHPEQVLHGFLVTDQIFQDGLSKDRFISSIKWVFKAKLQGVWEIQKRFGTPKEEQEDLSSDISMYV